ncbi:MAG: glycosyltransferase family 2 protein, partial [Lachnospiraceae bacterium]|nr:glycosyltransferase family 2 protein [Lachnospiraceae bacterium]
INNFGAKDATGELLLLLNNDVELIGDDALEMLAMTVMRSDVAAAGAKLIYADGTVQHGGVAVGLGGVAGHDHVGFFGDEAGYLKQLVCARDVSAVTAACLMMKKSVFDSIGGFNEEYAVDFNDIDLCMRIRRAGGKIIFQPLCKAYHYESKTRGNVKKTADAQKRFEGEVHRFMRDWGSFLKKGDPFYNPYLTLARNDHSLGNPYMFEI